MTIYIFNITLLFTIEYRTFSILTKWCYWILIWEMHTSLLTCYILHRISISYKQSWYFPISGIFHFYFWWYGHWKEVIIDDYLPTDGQRLIYISNWEERDEYWGALLEKAYAKCVNFGCYFIFIVSTCSIAAVYVNQV